MDNHLILNQSITSFDIQDEIHERLTKAQAITSCLLANQGGEVEIPYRSIYGVVWTVDGLLEELEQLFARLDKEAK